MSVGRLQGQPRRQPAGLLHRRDRLPPVHAAREGPARRARTVPEAIPRVTSVEWAEDGTDAALRASSTRRPSAATRSSATRSGAANDDAPLRGEGRALQRRRLEVASTASTCSSRRGSLTTTRGAVPARGPSPRPRCKAGRRARAGPRIRRGPPRRHFWIRTNDKGRNFRLVTAPASDPSRANWKEVVAAPRRRDAGRASACSRTSTSILEREGGLPHLRVTDFRNGQSHRIEFPEAAYLAPRARTASSTRGCSGSPTSRPSTSPSDLRLRPRHARARRCSSRWRCSAATTRPATRWS